MAQADSVRSPLLAPITGAISKASANPYHSVDTAIEQPKIAKVAIGYRVVVLGYATAVLLLGWFPWNVVLILLLFLCRSDRGGAL